MMRDHTGSTAIVPSVAYAFVVLAACWIFVAPARAAEEDARVLILNAMDPYLPVYLAIDAPMRAALSEETARPVILLSEALDAQRFAIESLEPELVAFLTKKYSALRIDVVVAVTQAALEFVKRHRDGLWPGARIVYVGYPGEAMGPPALPAYATGVVTHTDLAGTIDIAWRLQPHAKRILVISGAADLDNRAEQLARQELSMRTEKATVEYLSGLPLPELIARVAAEPANTIILYLVQFRDRDGRPYTSREVLRAISRSSVAPVYAGVETYLGFGVVAGSMESYTEKGRLIAEQIRSALASGPSNPSRVLLTAPSRCVADARLMKRWSLDERRLPQGCDVRFADRSLWREYFWQILAGLAIIVGQAILIAALLVQHRRRRLAESEARKRYSEMAHMNRRVAIGEISASIAHELNQPLGAIHNNAGAAQLLINADPPKLEQVAEILGDIKRDNQRASDIIARIRKLLRKTEADVQSTDLNEAIDETVKMLAAEASNKDVLVKTELEAGLAAVGADRVQVQQVIMNLILNALDAMRGQSPEKSLLMIRSRRTNEKEAEVAVADTGPGIPAESISGIFNPFVTSKPGGLGLGLAISRTIVEAHGGQIHAENAPGGGAVFRFTLPFSAVSRA
jgi:signal transduction histidine kinase